jgi:hypothetical protein
LPILSANKELVEVMENFLSIISTTFFLALFGLFITFAPNLNINSYDKEILFIDCCPFGGKLDSRRGKDFLCAPLHHRHPNRRERTKTRTFIAVVHHSG